MTDTRTAPTVHTRRGPLLSRAMNKVRAWFDSDALPHPPPLKTKPRVDWIRALPFVGIHLVCLGIFFVGFSVVAVVVALVAYALRMFAITGFYHRYFSHRSFKTSRFWQFVFALLGNTAAQRGPLWWAAHHRHHHRRSDREEDTHSPRWHGILWSHTGWFLSQRNFRTDLTVVPDLAKYPELRFLNRFDWLAPFAFGAMMFGLGALLQAVAPGLGTSGVQMFVWGFAVSTVLVYHATYTINSLSHRFGKRRFETKDDSRNNFLLALLTFGEGWHNNHHHYPASTRQGFYWWEIDLTYYALRVLSWFGIVRDLRPVPRSALASRRVEPEPRRR